MPTKEEMAQTFADFVKNNEVYYGKSPKEIRAILLKLKNKLSPDKKDNIPEDWAPNIYKVYNTFAGKGPVEIKDDLDNMSSLELEDFIYISQNLPALSILEK